MNATELDAKMILRLLRAEHLTKPGESDGFTLDINGTQWEMKLKRESEVYLPFKYSLTGRCTEPTPAGTHATESRRFTTIDGALLHCLNHFNENANVRNKYNNIEDAFVLR